jgi:hypothetical protein
VKRPHLILGLAFLGAVVILAWVAAPSRAADSVSETRKVSGFDRIRLAGAFETVVTVGEPASLTLSGDPEAVGRIMTEVGGGTLIIGTHSDGWPFHQMVKLTITLPALHGFASEGVGPSTISGLAGGDIEISTAGAGSIVASGRAENEDVSLSGVGKIDTTALDARDVTVSNSGLGTVHVRASGNLTMSVSGLGTIRYTGNPSHVESQISGLGRIGRL